MRLFNTPLLLLLSFAGIAQNAYWTLPANGGLGPCNAGGRMDDLYFWTPHKGVVVSSYGYIAKTVDGGDSWLVKHYPGMGTYFRSIEVLDNAATMIASALNGTVFRSTDSGESWTNISAAIQGGSQGARNICGLAHEGSTFYGVGWYGAAHARFFKSTDAGLTWQTSFVDTTLATGLVDIISLGNGVLFASGGRRFDTNRQASVVLRSTDGGSSWTKVFEDTVIGGRIWKLQSLSPTTLYGSVEPLYDVDTVAIIRSRDGGSSWEMIGAGRIPTTNWGNQGVGFLNEARGWVGGYYSGMFETTDSGKSWQYIPQGRDMNRFFRVNSGLMYASGRCPIKFYDSAAAASVPHISEGAASSHRLLSPSPNPASHNIVFRFELGYPSNCALDVVDISGRRIFHVFTKALPNGHHEYTWDCSALSPGVYSIRLETDEGPLGQTFAVAR